MLCVVVGSLASRVAGRQMSGLASHGRFPYSPIFARPAGSWPNGKRLAVYIAINLEHFAFGEGLGGELVPAGGLGRLGGGPDVLNWSWREYGNRVGAYRLLELLDDLSMPAAALVNSELAAHAPELVEAHAARGDEIVAHGVTNSERQGDMDEAAETACIARVSAALGAVGGWLGPWISESDRTPDLLEEAGYSYVLDWCHDDEPQYMRTRSGGSLLSVPYAQELNDIPSIMVRRVSAADFADMIIDNLDEMLDQASVPDGPPLVMSVALHPYIVGQPFRIRHLRRALDYLASRRDEFWLTTPGAIAHAYRQLRPPGVTATPQQPLRPLPRIDGRDDIPPPSSSEGDDGNKPAP